MPTYKLSLIRSAAATAALVGFSIQMGSAVAQEQPAAPPAKIQVQGATQDTTGFGYPDVPTAVPAAPVAPASAPMGLIQANSLSPETDHDLVVNHWGVTVRRMGSFARTAGQDPTCGTNCQSEFFSLGVRRWSSRKYAWNLGLALGSTSGATRTSDGGHRAWDASIGVGPSLGASFLLANWKHMAVSVGPQLDVLYFMPSGSGAKTLLVNVRGELEGEIHLGMLGLPAASLGVVTGLGARYSYSSKGNIPVANTVARRLDIEVLSPLSLGDVVTKTYLRYYF